ncbi:MAG: DUF2480 family protein [Chitinophagaceae bacterium]|nr:MAG: DUF2480 family protein [Chitinophagaceae bacterium]
MDSIVNKIAVSGIITIDPVDFLPKEEILVFDLKPFLFRELILKEKDFREALKNQDWEQYRDKTVAVTCSADAIIPMWAFMLVTSYLASVASDILFGDNEEAIRQSAIKSVDKLDLEEFRDQRLVLKGCGDRAVPADVYIALMKKLKPVVKSVMFGEPCSTVPVYKKK